MNEKWNKRFINLAKEVSTWSKDPSTKVGCVIINPENKSILSMGYNGLPRGMEDSAYILNNRELKYPNIIHAELNAILNAAYNGVELKNSHLYVWGLPICASCAGPIMQVGIKEVYFSYDKNDKNKKWEKEFKADTIPKLDSGSIFYEEI